MQHEKLGVNCTDMHGLASHSPIHGFVQIVLNK